MLGGFWWLRNTEKYWYEIQVNTGRRPAKHRKRLDTEKYSEETQGNTGTEEKCGETQRQCGLERPGHQQSCWNVKTPWEAADYNIANMPTEEYKLFLEN